MKTTVREFLADHPEAVAYGKRLKQAIDEGKVSLKGNPYQILQRALDYEQRGWEHSIERWFDKEDERARKKFEQEYKEKESK
jgi:hypothetical protein